MTDYHTVNLEKEYYQDLEKFLEDKPRYPRPKQFIIEAINEKREKIEQQELKEKETKEQAMSEAQN
jgi:hypothetical protein